MKYEKDAQIMKTVLDFLGLTPYAMAKNIGRSDSSIYHVLKGRRELAKPLAERINEIYPVVNYEFLTGNMSNVQATEEQMETRKSVLDMTKPQRDNAAAETRKLRMVVEEMNAKLTILIEILSK